MTCLHCLLCDNLKCETRDAVANPGCQTRQNQEVRCWMEPTVKLCFPPSERVWLVLERGNKSLHFPNSRTALISSPKHGTESRNTTSQARWRYCFEKQQAHHMNVKVFLSLWAMELKLSFTNEFNANSETTVLLIFLLNTILKPCFFLLQAFNWFSFFALESW